jgi:fermentation-respiration switch protein FrsA (DUF1100 family)
VLRLLVWLVVVGVGLLAFVRWLEPRFAFFPSQGESTTPAEFGTPFTATTLDASDGERLQAWLLTAAEPRALIVYFHGNGGNLSMWAPILSDIAGHGYNVLAIDYRGYGLSTGRPTESGVYRDADAVLAHLSTLKGDSRPIIYWGRSLGTAIAAYAASRRPPDGIILEAGFPDARAIVRSSPVLAFLSLFASYRFPTAAWLAGTDVPALAIHGDADQVIPYALGRALFDRIGSEKTFVTIPGGDHNDATPADEQRYWDGIRAFVRRLAERRPVPNA